MLVREKLLKVKIETKRERKRLDSDVDADYRKRAIIIDRLLKYCFSE